MKKILEVNCLNKGNILKDISFQVEKGEMVAVMGPSGSGKSTLLYQVSGMDCASSGEILLNDRDIMKMNEDEKAKLRLNRMGFVFQQMNMLKNLNIRDNILFPAYQAERTKKGKEQAEHRADELMKKMNIQELAERKITEVSGGQLQRACICRSMINRPDILFADEPTGALNQSATWEVMEELQKVNREGTTILMVTHDSKVAGRCDRIIYILDGSIKGELAPGKWEPELTAEKEKDREEKIGSWLEKMGW